MNSYCKNTVITTSIKASKTVYFVLNDLKNIFPNSIYFKRKNYKIRQIVSYLKRQDTKNLILLVEDFEKTIQWWHFDLENNFLVKYNIISIILRTNIDKCGKISTHKPELLFDEFKGNVNWVIGTMMRRFFDGLPDFKGRQVLSFYKRKEFIFIRYHRYIFSVTGKDVKLQELGPKLSLKFENFFKSTIFLDTFF